MFGLSAALAVLVGTALAGFAGGDPNAGSPYLFESLAAVVIGGYGRDRHLRNKV
ncbi:branched-subunit amino acid ABC-type transport system permease component [Amycolatopsis jiangsuensis]|uniref:Branched-subunit amino acid ABC-type transport system permease component n=1 Tax=Amycolatopsis jiangsuensis TaxID=1181879 RepID=A0A840J751_9PSEU|nr:branched-subunit amino acid ABC-type transport system permease component [Amycolatopsis jiangsuensis]